ncbi:helix-turn-helix transcriptional regulator [Burkholderia sp. BCCIQ04A]|uniref:Helix-turn-helix transcriptional regulator n=2 Tax=Burkholderia TaxID=32008 RepID=A0ABU5WR80_9BURK|nr:MULTISPECIES: helix-turn-helix transcriptional regulator [Burkholderia]MEB2504762.1 helix-turn-helix transcriptional regulator [Burkholderia anthinoferrum]MEB2534885.1 helix-turn-helix transcriptional regulator [Burkholderia anthinoferrum]MEB2560539.1 helix-turn-helix transcriptional regulator [Burkholderia anthinoferrum]MEB2581467.1 helix-turn-helix transcriptional regulator [Burkholderia anthinoferrum]MEB2638270.1 helix-turn-helix transcriptional regulator [Burkholderia anthinoferrum]
MIYGQRYEKLRHVLKQVRREAGLTQVQLAEALGRGQSYVSKVERGEQYLDVLEFIEWCEACATPSEIVIKKI